MTDRKARAKAKAKAKAKVNAMTIKLGAAR
jgi:hypothetical protein